MSLALASISSIFPSAVKLSDRRRRCRPRSVTKAAGAAAAMKWGSEVVTTLILTLFLVERKCAPSIQSANKETEAPLNGPLAPREGGEQTAHVELKAGASPCVSFCRCCSPSSLKAGGARLSKPLHEFFRLRQLHFPSQYWRSPMDADGENPKKRFFFNSATVLAFVFIYIYIFFSIFVSITMFHCLRKTIKTVNSTSLFLLFHKF